METVQIPRIPQACEAAERDFAAHGLTDRERDAARSVLAGLTAESASRAMGVTPSSVGGFRRRAYRKLGVECARELALRYHGEKNEELDASMQASARCALLAKGLNETQADVLSRVAAGRSTPEIAEELHLAPGTVSSARSNGYRLLGVHSREELVGLLREEAATPERRRRRARRIALGFAGAAAVIAVCAALAAALLPVDALGELLAGNVTNVQSVNGVLYAVNEDGLTFGSVKRANLPMPWEDAVSTMSAWDNARLRAWESCPDLIAVTSRSEASGGELGYIRRDDFVGGCESGDSWVIVYDLHGREIGTLRLGALDAYR